MLSYVVYGLTVSSALELPELVEGESRAVSDITIQLGRVERCHPEGDFIEGYVSGSAEKAYIFVDQVGAFLVRGGFEIVIEPAPGVEERVLRLFILGGALGLLLHQRGMLVLHASAVSLEGNAVAFLGDAGEGKSTMAAALHARGHAVMVDDVVAFDAGVNAIPMVLPAFPQLKLWPEAASLLDENPEALPRVHPDLDKRARRTTCGFSKYPLPLSRIYVLGEESQPEIIPLQPQAAFAELVRHSYAVGLLGPSGATPAHFRQCVALAGSGRLYRLNRPRSLHVVPEIARLVEVHVSQEVGRANK